MTEHEEVMEALRRLWSKLADLEKKVDSLFTPKGQAAMKLAGAGAKKPPNPAHTLLQGRLLKTWVDVKGVRYAFAARDAKGIADLLRRAIPMDQLVARWVYAIKNGCDSIHSFEMNFNRWDPSVESNRPVVDGTTDLYAEQKP